MISYLRTLDDAVDCVSLLCSAVSGLSSVFLSSALIHESGETDSFTVSILMEFYLRMNFLLGI